jgi:CheY-like chemotaxis protein
MSKNGLRVFLVEDEAMIRMMVVDMFEELGHAVSAEAGQLDQGLQLAQSADFDLAM